MTLHETDTASPLDPREEAFLQAELDRAMAPYVGAAPPYVLRAMRQAAEDAMRSSAVLVEMRRRLVREACGASHGAPTVGERSGERLVAGVDPADEAASGGRSS